MEGPAWIDKELREVLYTCRASKSCKTKKATSLRKEAVKGWEKGLRGRTEMHKSFFPLSNYSAKNGNEKDFVQMLPFYFQLCSCWFFPWKGAHNIFTFNKTSNNTRKRQDFPLEKADIFVCYLKIFPYPFTGNNIPK